VFDVLVLGSGIAGLTTALRAARQGMSVLVMTKGELSHSATRYAQGGVAAALAEPDSPDLHLADTLVAGAGLCDTDAVRILVTEGPMRVRELAALGASFDTEATDDGASLLLAREGGHSLARVVHAGGDQTGAEIERALVAALHRVDVEVRESWFALELLVERDRCAGVLAIDPNGEPQYVRALDTVLATGGAGQCFAVTTNPSLSTGDGIALALRAGVVCADLEFMQFHPTALHHPAMPRPLLSEALRGEGAVLRDENGVAFMADIHPLADLAPRDVVSRAIARHLREVGADHVWLDATMIDEFPDRFPTIWGACQDAGLDPTTDWLPVAPAAHYMSGGVVADLDGATTLPRLWACGETSCSGVHGANRLASNSLLDGLVFGRRVVDAIAGGKSEADPTGVMAAVLDRSFATATADPVVLPQKRTTDPAKLRGSIQRVMTQDCGVLREADGLQLAAETLTDLAALAEDLPARQPGTYEAMNLARVARAIVASATARVESRGSHTRTDYPDTTDKYSGRYLVAGDAEPQFAPLHQPVGRGR
jgi:L-aspartate oxidase